jgi:hypothetical protein
MKRWLPQCTLSSWCSATRAAIRRWQEGIAGFIRRRITHHYTHAPWCSSIRDGVRAMAEALQWVTFSTRHHEVGVKDARAAEIFPSRRGGGRLSAERVGVIAAAPCESHRAPQPRNGQRDNERTSS